MTTAATTLTTPDVPDADFVFGIATGPLHAVSRNRVRQASAALHNRSRELEALTECGIKAAVAIKWGSWSRSSPHARIGLCPHCAWSVAIATGTIHDELASLIPDSETVAALAAAGIDPHLVPALCSAIVATASEPRVEFPVAHPRTRDLLGHVTAHAPSVLVHEPCAEGGCDHTATDPCPTQIACPTCSLRAGTWAGEWEGQFDAACTVTYPCTVLLTVAAHYGLATTRPSAGGGHT